METLIRAKIVKFLDANNLISPYQSGFRYGQSTLSQLLLASNALVKCADDRACVDSVYTDLSKAFDSISHIKIIHKLRAYDINNNVYD